MATSKIFQKVPIEVPNRSGFNMSHNNGFSAPVGTLVPFFWDFLLPKDEIDLGSAFQIQLPPLATDFIGELDGRIEYFSVPVRTLFGGWKDFVINPLDDSNNPSDIEGQLAKYLIGAKVYGSYRPSFDAISGSPGTYSRTNDKTSLESYTEDFSKVIDEVLNDVSNPSIPFYVKDHNTSVYPGSLADNLGFKVVDGSILFDEYNEAFDSDRDRISSRLKQRTSADLLALKEIPQSYYKQYDESFSAGSGGSKTITVTLIVENLGNQLNARFYILSSNVVPEFEIKINNILPFLAYHKVYEDWYRDSKLQKSLFKRQVANTTAQSSVANMPWITSGADSKIYFTGEQLNFANGHSLFEMHQRNFQKDYYTSSTPEPQSGAPAKVSFDIQNSSGEFTIASLRAANSLQQFLDRQNIAGFRYGDQIFSQYGVYPPDEITQRAIYLGSQTVPVYNKSVYQQSGDGGTNTNNPFNIIGAKYANAMGVSQTGFVVENYEVKDYCIVIGIFSLVPKVRYSSGTRRFFHYNDVSDIAFPMLAGVGDQEILKRELVDIYSGEGNTDIFGYTQRYAEYKFIDDQIHGLLRDGNDLQSFALQRSFGDDVELGSSFIEIPKDYLDQVSAADYKISKYGCWVDTNISYFKASTLPAYSIPTLEDLKNTHTVIIDKNGKRL